MKRYHESFAMIDPSLVQSGFDSETLFNRRYIRYLLMNSIETGSLPLQISFPITAPNGQPSTVNIDLYVPADYERNYTPDPAAPQPVNSDSAAFDVEILFNDAAGADLKITLVGDVSGILLPLPGQVVELFMSFQLRVDTDEDGNQQNARLQLATVDVQGDLIDLVINLGYADKAFIIGQLQQYVDREIPLSMVGDGSVQSVEMQKLRGADIDTHVIAIYLNLILKNGPAEDDIRPARGLVSSGVNFLPSGDDIAFGMPSTIFDRLSTDAFERMAEETSEGSGVFNHPIPNPDEPDGDPLGRINSITIRPKYQNGTFTDELEIVVDGEIIWDWTVFGVDVTPDPNFKLYITISPVVTNGIISWDISYDLDFDPVLKFLANLVVAGLMTLLFVPTLGWGSLIVGGIGFALLYGLEDWLIEPMIANGFGESADFDTSFLDSIPNRLTVESKRWDPFYTTDHQIVAATDGMAIRDTGLGFSGKVKLDKAARFVTHIVSRTEERDGHGDISGLRYRVKDHANAANDFVNHFAATDRESFVQVTDDAETNLYALTLEEINSRITAGKLIPRILYIAQNVHIKNNQVEEIAAITDKEVKEITNRLKDDFKEAKETEIRADQEDELRDEATEELEEELDDPPTDEQIEERLQDKIDKLVGDALDEYVLDQLDTDVGNAVKDQTRFDMAPFEMASLQLNRVLILSRFDIVVRQGKPYYRDRPDGYIPDNLMELPGFTPDED